MKHLFVILFLFCGLSVFAQPKINDKPKSSVDFPLCAGGESCDIFVSPEDFEVVKKAASLSTMKGGVLHRGLRRHSIRN